MAPRQTQRHGSSWRTLTLSHLAVALLVTVACNTGRLTEGKDAGGDLDADVSLDARSDSGDLCAAVACAPGQECVDGVCMLRDRCDGVQCATPGEVCDPRDGACTVGDSDEDGDGFTIAAGDCHDGDARINPEHAEECDGLDNDCDRVVDEGLVPRPCSTECGRGLETCDDGAWVCPVVEECEPGAVEPCVTACGTPGTRTCSHRCSFGICMPPVEECNGVDEDCDGVYDDGTTLPSVLDSLEYVEPGFFGVVDSAVYMTWSDLGAYWDGVAGAVTNVSPLEDLWSGLSPSGTPPPADGVDAMMLVPEGSLGYTADTLFVSAGPTVYWLTEGDMSWSSSPIGSTVDFLTTIDAMTSVRAGDWDGLTEDWILVVSGTELWILTSTEWVGPSDVGETFCPVGTVGPCPPGVESLMRMPGPPATLFIQYAGTTYSSPILFDDEGALAFTWSTFDTGEVSCAH